MKKYKTKTNQIKILKGSRGITLIALVITIIVLLILAAISIATLTGDNGILTKAQDAKNDTVVGEEKEQIKLAYDASMADNYEKGDYTTGVTSDKIGEHLRKQGQNVEVTGTGIISIKFKNTEHEYTVDGKTGKITKIEDDKQDENLGKTMSIRELKVGDYIKYGEKLTPETYNTNIAETGYETSQTFETDTAVLWQVISNDENGVQIVAVDNTFSNTEEMKGLSIKGEIGWNNIEKVLNDLCRKLYTSENYGEARSIKFEDLATLYNLDSTIDDYDIIDENIINESSPLYDIFIGNNESAEKENSLKWFWLANSDSMPGPEANDHDFLFAYFWTSTGVDKEEIYYGDNSCANGVRPIVVLNSKVEVDISDASADGSLPEKAYILK